ncbi:unnamed protein product [Didymodactylos carnosus]|uniref:Uncharacterized protein n=1 Tax=Didymodactylos carnosus TaxID=1234261 RepID=A0A8S2EKP3_9BILA|nr:unnamed protein product [Didymodactylos carnosus]CAF3982135.1 unnamed protein product [Didymodactylos carnosus]
MSYNQDYQYLNSNGGDDGGMRSNYQNEQRYDYYNNGYRNNNYLSNSSYHQYNHNLEYINSDFNYTNFSNNSNNQISYITPPPSYNSSSCNWLNSHADQTYLQKKTPRHPKYDRNNPFRFTSIDTQQQQQQPQQQVMKNDLRTKNKAKRLRELARQKKQSVLAFLIKKTTNPLESWKQSVKKANISEGLEQKSQYLETMLRLKQKPSVSSSTFDRTRFADDETLKSTARITNTLSIATSTELELIGNIHEYDDIAKIENFLFSNNNEILTPASTSPQQQMPSSSTSVDNIEHEKNGQQETTRKPGQGFLIDCDEDDMEEQQGEPSDSMNINDDQPKAILSDLALTIPNDNPRVRKKSKKKKKRVQLSTEEEAESLTNWIVEFPTTSPIDDHSITTTSSITPVDNELLNSILNYDDSPTNNYSQLLSSNQQLKRPHVDMILTMIKDQQEQLKKLRSCVMMALGISPNSSRKSSTSSSIRKINSLNINEELIKTFLNAQQTVGCWLCSAKKSPDEPDPDMTAIKLLFKRLNIPLSPSKTADPAMMIEHLGIIFDTRRMLASLPEDKRLWTHKVVKQYSLKRNCTKRELVSLLGYLDHAP